jgi:hypothetical protein
MQGRGVDSGWTFDPPQQRDFSNVPDHQGVAFPSVAQCLGEPARSYFAPLATTLQMRLQPARLSSSFCMSRLWSFMETRA